MPYPSPHERQQLAHLRAALAVAMLAAIAELVIIAALM